MRKSVGVVLYAAVRGVVAAMCMSGMRTLTVRLGLLGRTPPQMAVEEYAGGGWLERIPKERREAVIELLHWAYGAGGGALFGTLPARLRLQRWVGPVYGTVLWLGFEAVVAPLFGLDARRHRSRLEQAALSADHLLYGAVLAELRPRPQR